ncbi:MULTISPECIES: DNA-methyltransferase [Streptomyces]|uniref:Methyltransferase n=1 Tax=Streptomyces flavovirens TaxID=52258 RepID=A0ABV8NE02_9ACTN|nr:site-specific DNA-methyltransferase [Streptomyces sp. MBT51]MBK3596276.1 site-specific DNA-methyltransferase [Streptomyces sp. MBT51]
MTTALVRARALLNTPPPEPIPGQLDLTRSTVKPYYEDETVALYHGDMREVLPALSLQADLVVADPPYAETSLAWDRWPDGWPTLAATAASSMWCFGSMRMFLQQHDQFADWRLSQDVVWEKHNGTGFARDRFRRVHENVTHWYRGPWSAIHHEVPRAPTEFDPKDRTASASAARVPHTGAIGAHRYEDDGLRLARSVQRVQSVRGGLHPTEKPLPLLSKLITYACPTGGLVLDPFAGSGSTLDAARQSGRRVIGIEADERYCEAAARRLSALVLDIA